MRVITIEEARRYDSEVQALGVSGLVLMENACGVASEWVQQVAPSGPLLILCGPGNNGGDGLGIARRLHVAGRELVVALGQAPGSGDAKTQYQRCLEHGLTPRISPELELSSWIATDEKTWVVDAMFGTGLSRPLQPPWSTWVAEIAGNQVEGRIRGVLAIDLPSGTRADRAISPAPQVLADATITFVAEKPACLLSPNAESCGAVTPAEIGVDPTEVLGVPTVERLTEDQIVDLVPTRSPGAHKGTFGHLMVVGGSRGMSGAPSLTARAGLRSGVGMVTVAAPGPLADRIDIMVPEATTLSLACDCSENFAIDAIDEILERIETFEALALGPGLGAAGVAREVARQLVLGSELPLVLDADGLNAFAGRLQELSDRQGATVLTPHPGELARLLDCDLEQVLVDPLDCTREAVQLCGQVVVLKGAGTVIGAPGSSLQIVRAGNSGMATAGSGDVLTGIVGSLLAQGLSALDAARVAVWVHAVAGAEAADLRSEAG